MSVILSEHFTMKSDLNILLLPTTASVVLVRSDSRKMCSSGEYSERWCRGEAGKVFCVLFPDKLWIRHIADMSFKATSDTRGWWVKWLQAAESRQTLLILQPPRASEMVRYMYKGTSTLSCDLRPWTWGQSLNRQTRLNVLNFPSLEQ